MVQAADGVESAAAAAAKAALPRAPDGAGDGPPLLGLWSAWIVALVAAFVAWVWYGRGGGEEEGAKGASSSGSGTPGKSSPSPSPSRALGSLGASPPLNLSGVAGWGDAPNQGSESANAPALL